MAETFGGMSGCGCVFRGTGNGFPDTEGASGTNGLAGIGAATTWKSKIVIVTVVSLN